MAQPKDEGTPAFPRPGWNGDPVAQQDGMTLRQWYAGMAVAGELASTSTRESVDPIAKQAIENNRTAAQQIAHNAFEVADAMIEEGRK